MTLQEAQQLVFDEKPIFAKLYKEYKDRTWIEYAHENFPKKNNTTLSKELTDSFHDLLEPLVGDNTALIAVQELNRSKFVSTCDHHGVLWHPFFLHSTLLRSSQGLVVSSQKKKMRVTISLTCGGVSLSNSSYPRGIVYHDRELDEVRVPFVHRSNSPVYGYPGLAKGKLLSDQFVTLNDVLWHQIFGSSRGSLIYLQAESLVRKLLLEYHLNKDTLISKILFDSATRATYIQHYDGVIGAHTGMQKGTHLFWYVDEHHRRVQLWIDRDKLASTDKTIAIPFTPTYIRQCLTSYQLLPSMALCYSMLSCYYGLTLGGGFSQIQYLGDMQHAYEEVERGWGDGEMKRRGGEEEERVRTDIFTGEFVAVGLSNGKTSVPATLIDLLLYGKDDVNKIIDQQFSHLAIGQSLDLMMPEFVHIITGKLPKISNMPKVPSTLYVR